MSSKPSTVPTWDSGAVNVATPSAGRIASGYANGAVPTAGEINYLFMWLSLWTQYLSDGNFQGAASFAAGITIPTGQSVTLAGTADLKHPSRELAVSPVGGVYAAGSSYDQTNKYAINSASSQVSLPILGLKVGDRINTVDFNHFGNASAYTSVFTLNKMTAAGIASIVATSGSISTPTGASWSTYTLIVGSPVAVAAGEVWWLEWLPNAVVQRLQGANVKFDRP